ncbi:MAG: hypothetical protein COA58_03290 [Bacteroidetes bacterium]|nr:MAG: hypothetical protein COA58_03290 [Bacteroidota bacterium]
MKEDSTSERDQKEIICIPEKDTKKRFVLGQKGEKNLLVIALNPSKANEERLDPTSRNVASLAERYSCDGWLMANLSPIRTSKPENLPTTQDQSIFDESLIEIIAIIKGKYGAVDKVLLSWGNNIVIRPYLAQNAKQIMDAVTSSGISIYALRLTAAGHPYHCGPRAVNRFLGGIEKAKMHLLGSKELKG